MRGEVGRGNPSDSRHRQVADFPLRHADIGVVRRKRSSYARRDLARGLRKMYPTYLERIASMAEKACALAIDKPGDTQAREQLFDVLAEVADPAFQGDDPDLDHLSGLFSQARVWAVIVRT